MRCPQIFAAGRGRIPQNPRHGGQDTHAGYNSQVVTDDQHGLIVNTDVVQDNNDRKQFTEQIQAAREITGETPEVAGADHFLLRGLAGVHAEMSLPAGCFNVSRLIGLFGVAWTPCQALGSVSHVWRPIASQAAGASPSGRQLGGGCTPSRPSLRSRILYTSGSRARS